MDSEIRREIAGHQQANLARLARTELLLADVVLPRPVLLIAALSRLARLRPRRSQEQVPDSHVEITG